MIQFGVLQALGGFELAVGTGRVVEDLCGGAHDVLVSTKTSSWQPEGPEYRRTKMAFVIATAPLPAAGRGNAGLTGA